MVCLHLCNDFLGSSVYERLYLELDKQSIEQHIYHPFRKENRNHERNINFSCENSDIYYSKPLKKYHRILFRSKINFLLKDIRSRVNLEAIEIIHATTLFSDGSLAYKLHQEFKLPYIVTVRMTDISVFLRFRPDLIFLGLKILKNASKIIFITPTLKEKLFEFSLFNSKRALLEPKSVIMQNGIHQFWIDNRISRLNKKDPNKILYVGTFKKRKNVVRLMRAILELREENPSVQLTIVGDGGADYDNIQRLTAEYPSVFHFVGPVQEKQKLLEIFRSHDIFAMPSFHETFGLVYIEALSQGLPIIYSEKQGIDGIFNLPVGEAVNPDEVSSIAKSIDKIIKEYNRYELDKIDFNKFSWQSISEEFANIYRSIER